MAVQAVFTNASTRTQYEAGEVVFAEGDQSPTMFGVVTGSIELRKDGEPVVTIGPGQTFGEMGIISRAPRSLDAVAVEPTELAVIDERTFVFLVQETPMFALQVMQAMAERIRQLDES